MCEYRLHDQNYKLQNAPVNGSLTPRTQKQHATNIVEKRDGYTPCFLVAKFFRDDLPQLEAEPVGNSLRQILVGAPAENLNIRHLVVFRGLALRSTDSFRTEGLTSQLPLPARVSVRL